VGLACLNTNIQSGQLKETRKQNGFVDVFKQLIIILNSVIPTILIVEED
jgi:hypothetical protein